jgi:hypothetical protein
VCTSDEIQEFREKVVVMHDERPDCWEYLMNCLDAGALADHVWPDRGDEYYWDMDGDLKIFCKYGCKDLISAQLDNIGAYAPESDAKAFVIACYSFYDEVQFLDEHYHAVKDQLGGTYPKQLHKIFARAWHNFKCRLGPCPLMEAEIDRDHELSASVAKFAIDMLSKWNMEEGKEESRNLRLVEGVHGVQSALEDTRKALCDTRSTLEDALGDVESKLADTTDDLSKVVYDIREVPAQTMRSLGLLARESLYG